VTVNGWGLQIASQKDGGSVSVVNNGAVVLDDTAATQTSALTIVGHGGLASYSGSGSVRNEIDAVIFSDALRITNTTSRSRSAAARSTAATACFSSRAGAPSRST
jgi:hypothetical protein